MFVAPACGRCNGDGDIGEGQRRQTCPVCRGSGLGHGRCAADVEEHCPRCDSPAPHLHPAVQHEGEVQPCAHPYHSRVTPENTPAKIAETRGVMDCGATKQWLAARDDGGLVRIDSLRRDAGGYTMVGDFIRYRRAHASHGAHVVFNTRTGEEQIYAGCAEVIPEQAPRFVVCEKHDAVGVVPGGICGLCREEAS